MMALVFILIAEILGGFTLRELDSWLIAMEPVRVVMAVCDALRADGRILSFALAVMRMGRSPPWTSSAEII